MVSTHIASHNWRGVALAIGSAVLFGAVPPFSKPLLDVVQPGMLAGLLYLGVGVGCAAYSLIGYRRPEERKEARLSGKNLLWLCLIIASGGILAPTLLMQGLSLTNASTASLLLNVESLATIGMAWIVFGENLDLRLLVGASAILGGAALLSWQGTGLGVDAGALLVLAACLAWAIDNNLTRHISAANPVTITMWKGIVAAVVNISFALAAGATFPSFAVMAEAASLGFVGIGVSLVMFILALRHLGTARASAYYSLAPLMGALLAIGIFGEPLTVKLVFAGGLMSIGLWLHVSERHEHEHEHEAMEHEHMHIHDEHHQHAHAGSVTEPHSHMHRHEPLRHRHAHCPDLHHRHRHR